MSYVKDLPIHIFCRNLVPERLSDEKLILKTDKLCKLIKYVEKSGEYDGYLLQVQQDKAYRYYCRASIEARSRGIELTNSYFY